MNRYYFTYGSSKTMPFQAGWTVVEADSREDAIVIFDIVHPRTDGYQGFVNCAGIYDEEYFKTTKMYIDGNYGKGEVERLRIDRTVL